MFGWGIGNIIATSKLAAKVYAAYKDTPDDYKHISEEIMSLQVIINTAVQHFESTTPSGSDRQLGQEVLKGCQSVLEDLDSLIVNYHGLSSANTSQVLTRARPDVKDITTLKARLISHTGLLHGFIQRFG